MCGLHMVIYLQSKVWMASNSMKTILFIEKEERVCCQCMIKYSLHVWNVSFGPIYLISPLYFPLQFLLFIYTFRVLLTMGISQKKQNRQKPYYRTAQTENGVSFYCNSQTNDPNLKFDKTNQPYLNHNFEILFKWSADIFLEIEIMLTLRV